MIVGSDIITMRVVNPADGLVLRFKNDFGGRDLVHFAGNFAKEFNVDNIRTIEGVFSQVERSSWEVLSIEANNIIQCSRMFPAYNADGFRQLLTSRYVELFTGGMWLQVMVRLREWFERSKENMIFISIEIELPKRNVDEA